ncbi:MAG: hypothetical protein KDI17_02225 [Halioglobus sp.]|jgi:Na+-transporting methylmalonyl-CoA/oxaloacetate decarboxylase gamma subunit|nr:hypothetical protein [Halioglobus sp.]
MLTHTIVFATLSILSAIAIYAIGKPISKSSPAPELPGADTAHSADEEAPLPL